MQLHPLAGRHVPRDLLVDVNRLQQEYYSRQPDFADSSQRVRFGTSGHRGSSLRGAFNETHILAITQAICEYRIGQDITGPLFIGTTSRRASNSDQGFCTQRDKPIRAARTGACSSRSRATTLSTSPCRIRNTHSASSRRRKREGISRFC
jgi:hypothetical protein